MNLATRYPQIYWATACLTVNAREGDSSETESEWGKKASSIDYGKISKAISNIQQQGVRVLLPDINLSRQDFKPYKEENAILFGLGGIKGLGDDISAEIISKRPYASLVDFIEKTNFSTGQMATIIKSGMFDSLEKGRNRKELMKEYFITNYIKNKAQNNDAIKQEIEKLGIKELVSIASHSDVPQNLQEIFNLMWNRDKVTMANFNSLCEKDKAPEFLELEKKHYFFRDHLNKHCLDEDKKYYVFDADQVVSYFTRHYIGAFEEGSESFQKVGDVYRVSVKEFKKIYDKKTEKATEWIKTSEASVYIDQKLLESTIEEEISKHMKGSEASWEMDTLGFYPNEHELSGVVFPDFKVENFHSLPEEPDKELSSSGKEYVITTYIAGTIGDFDKNKRTIVLITEKGPIDVKFSGNTYNDYGLQLSVVDKSGKKRVTDKSWLARGNKVLLHGFRSGDFFIVRKNYKKGATVGLVEGIGSKIAIIKTERNRG